MNWADWLGLGVMAFFALGAVGHFTEEKSFLKKLTGALGTAIFGLFLGGFIITTWGQQANRAQEKQAQPITSRSSDMKGEEKEERQQRIWAARAKKMLATAKKQWRSFGFKECQSSMFCESGHYYVGHFKRGEIPIIAAWGGGRPKNPAWAAHINLVKSGDIEIHIISSGKILKNRYKVLKIVLQSIFPEKWEGALKTARKALESGKSTEDAETGFHAMLPNNQPNLIHLFFREEPWGEMAMSELNFWVWQFYPKHECKAFLLNEVKILHCAAPPYEKNAGKGSDIIFAMLKGAWHPLNGTTQSKIDSPYIRWTADEFGGVPVRKDFARGAEAIQAYEVFEAVRAGKVQFLK